MVDALVLGLHSMVVAEQERRYNLCYNLKPRAPYKETKGCINSLALFCLTTSTSLYIKRRDFSGFTRKLSVVTEQGVETLQCNKIFAEARTRAIHPTQV